MKAVVAPLLLLTLAEMGGAVGLFAVPVFAPAAAADLGIDPNWIGAFTGLAFVTAMFATALGASLIGRYGPIRTTQFGLVLMAATFVLLTSAWLPAFVLGSVCVGMAYGQLPAAAAQVLAAVSPSRSMGIVFAVKQSGNPIGGVLAGAVVPVLAVGFGWQVACVAVAVLCLSLAACLQLLRDTFDLDRHPDRRLTLRGMAEPWRLVLRNPKLRPLGLTGITFAALQTCISMYLVVYLVQDLKYDLVTAGLVLAISQSTGMASRLILGVMSGTVIDGRRLFGLTGLAMSLAASVLLVVTPEWPLMAIMILGAILGGSSTGWGGILMGELARRAPPGEAGRAAGGGASIAFVGGIMGPMTLGALVWATGSYGAGFFVLALVALGPSLLLSRPAPKE